MPSTSQLLTWIELECHGWTREGPRGTRALFNEAHRIFLTHPSEQRIVYDETTGNLPFVTTQSGVYKYDAPSTIWRIGDILVDATTSLGYGLQTTNTQWRTEECRIAGQDYLRLLNVRSHPSTPSAAASFRFVGVNPGDTTDTFRLIGWQKPVEVESDTIQHEMPDGLDMQYLVPATMMLIDSIDDHKKLLDARNYIEGVLKPRYWLEADKGTQGMSRYVTRRPA